MGKNKNIKYTLYPESDVIVDLIIKRFKKGLYTLVLVIGLPGTGKSSTCFRLSELVSKGLEEKEEIKPKIKVVDSFLQLTEFIRNANKGDVAVIEEVGVLFPSRRSMAHDNVSVGKVLDTCRKKQVILLANSPILKQVDSNIRSMACLSIETLKIIKNQKVVVSKPLRLQTNPGSGKTYTHRLSRGGKEVHRTYTRMPNKEIWEEYEEQKDKFMEKLYEKLKLQALDNDEKLRKRLGITHKVREKKPLSKREIEVYDLVRRQKMTQEEAAFKLGISQQRVSGILQDISKKLNIVGEKPQNKVVSSLIPAKS